MRIHSVHFAGEAHAARGSRWTLLGQDGGQSIECGEETLFVFSDTLLTLDPRGHRPPAITRDSAHFLGNCAALSNERTLDAAMRSLRYFEDEHGFPREILTPSPLERMAGHRFWPQHGIVLGDRLYLYYLGIHQFDAKSTWGFRPTGSGLARLDLRTGVAERITVDGEWRLWRGADDLRLGTQVIRKDDHLLVLGSARIEGLVQAIAARVPVHRIESASAYEFFAGAGEWTTNVRRAAPLATSAPEYSLSWNEHLGAYLLCYVDGFKRELFLRTGEEPWGPFGEPVSAGRLPHRKAAEVVALAFEHPRFARDGGRTVMISYCQPHFTQNSFIAVTFA